MQASNKSKFINYILIFMVVSVFVLFSLNAFVFTILEVKSYTDVDFMIPVFVDVIPYLTLISEITGILIAYACIIYTVYRFKRRQIVITVVSYVCLTLYKYIAKIAAGVIINESISALKGILSLIIYSVVIPILLDTMMLAIVLATAITINKKYVLFVKKQKSLENKLPDYKFDESILYFPIRKLWNKDNALQQTLFYTSIVIIFSQAVQLFIVDLQAGLPKNLIDFIWIITSYSMCVLLGIASYLFMLYILITLHRKADD